MCPDFLTETKSNKNITEITPWRCYINTANVIRLPKQMHASTVSAPINEEVEIKEEQIEHENNGTDNLN